MILFLEMEFAGTHMLEQKYFWNNIIRKNKTKKEYQL